MWLGLEDRTSARRASAPLPGQSQPRAFSRLHACRSQSALQAPLSRLPTALALPAQQMPGGLGRAGSLGNPGLEVCPVRGCLLVSPPTQTRRREISFKTTCFEAGGLLHAACGSNKGRHALPRHLSPFSDDWVLLTGLQARRECCPLGLPRSKLAGASRSGTPVPGTWKVVRTSVRNH